MNQTEINKTLPNTTSHRSRLEELKAELLKRKMGHSLKVSRATNKGTLSFHEELHKRVQRLAAGGLKISIHGETVILGHPAGGILCEKVMPTSVPSESASDDFFEGFLNAGTARYLEEALDSLGCQPHVIPGAPNQIKGTFMTRAVSAHLSLDSECGVFTLVLDLRDGTFRIQRDRQFGTWPTSVEINLLLNEIDVDLILLAKLGAFLSTRKIDWEPCDGVINWNNSRLMFSNAEILIANPPYFIAEENQQQFLEVPTIAREFLSALRTPPPPSVPTSPSTQMESDIELA